MSSSYLYVFIFSEHFIAVSDNVLKISGKLLQVIDVVSCQVFSAVSIEICISCGSLAVVANHPLFQGGLCKKCKVRTIIIMV